MLTLGHSALAKLIAAQQQAIATQGQAGEQFLVYVGALELYFLGQRAADKLQLTPLTTVPDLQLTPGKPMPAAEVFAILAPIAKAQSDQPS
jgi:hypothetical protein